MALLVTLAILVAAVVLAIVEARWLRRMGPFQVFAAGWVLVIATGVVSYLLAQDVAQGVQDAINSLGAGTGDPRAEAYPTFDPNMYPTPGPEYGP